VDDVSRALLTIIEKGNVNEIYNIGTNDEYSVVEILDILIKKMNIEKEKIDVIEYVEDRPFNDFRYSIDTSKLVKLGWEKQVSFDKGLDETIKWYKENY
jgi:dTDP-D-glucose 4,6-dehydratase